MDNTEYLSRINEAISAGLAPIIEENEHLRESYEEIRQMFAYEDQGWRAISGFSGGDQSTGLDLDSVKDIAKKARSQVAASSLPKQAVSLHTGYVFGNGVEIDGVDRQPGQTGRPKGVIAFYESVINQENIFSGAAKAELQKSRFTDGNVIVFCDSKDKTVRRIPLDEIQSVRVNPDHPEEIWAWLRSWERVDENGQSETVKRWVYSNRFPGDRTATIKDNDENIPVLKGVTAVDLRVNRQVGWAFGIPDATAGLHWSRAYGEVMRYGQIVNEGLSSIIYKVTGKKTKNGAAETGVKLSRGGTAQAAVMGEGQDIALVNATQRSFDFAAARPLAAMAAAAWHVPNIDLLSDSSAAGSSYGAAQALSEGVRNAMNLMRDEWTQFYQDIFAVFGFDRPKINWPPMEKPDAYRQAQELVLYSPWLKDEENRAIALDRLNYVADAEDTEGIGATAAKQQAAPGQGVSNNTGGQTSTAKNDMRDASESMAQRFLDEDFLNRLESLVIRMENNKG